MNAKRKTEFRIEARTTTARIPRESLEQTVEWWRGFWGHCSTCGEAGHTSQDCKARAAVSR